MGRETPGERGAVLAEAARLAAAAAAVTADHAAAVEEVRAALRPLVEELGAHELEAIPVGRLKDVTEGRVRLGAIEAAGLRSVADVLRAGRYGLRQLPGVGQQTADQAFAAAGQIARAVEGTVAVRFDVEHPTPGTTALLIALHRLVEAGPEARRAAGVAERLTAELTPLLTAAAPAAGRFRLWFTGREKRERALAAVAELRERRERADREDVPTLLGQASVDLLRAPADELAARVDFELRPADYYALLAELSGRGPDPAAAEGFLPAELADRVRDQPLDDTHRRVSLRGYQSFGARFALAQRRVILGDEMGLGKTIQAIAALAHLAASPSARGGAHFLVVCPAGVLVNWTREIRARSTLRAIPLHGPDRREAFAEWQRTGGVAVTTYDALRGFPAPGTADAPDPAGVPGAAYGAGAAYGTPAAPAPVPRMLVVDEAHYVKNPLALRSLAVAAWAGVSEHVLLLTGTPMENRVAEFRDLVRQVRPDLAEAVGDAHGAAGSRAFRAAVAPAYLRRNQVDVLTELPSLTRVDEWQELSAADLEAYREAVAAGNFMAMRRAAYARPESSAKLRRLRELVGAAAEEGRKVVVFSYFRDVLEAVSRALEPGQGPGQGQGPGVVLGPITGGVPPTARQALVDEFGAVDGPAVLLAQIEAGGVGLNLQAASVVVLCEPQVKPTVEHQAVARAHRMGQVRPVQVHRLLATTGVDRRLLEILAEKTRLFDAYARRSEVAEASPDAVDVSDVSLARRIVEEEQARLAAEATVSSAGDAAASAAEEAAEGAAGETAASTAERAAP
jgi:hypothetical protein